MFMQVLVVEGVREARCQALFASSCKFMQVLSVGGVCKLFYGKDIAIFRFWDGDRECLAPDAIKYKF